jgi:hypothetical protein
MKRNESFAARVRAALDRVGRGAIFRAYDLEESMRIQTREDRNRISTALRDMLRRGEVVRVQGEPGQPGRYEYVGRGPQKPNKKRVMWDYMRMRKKSGSPVTVEELQQMSGAGADYVREWLRSLLRLGVARDLGGGRFQLLADPVAMPESDEKAAKLREFRERKKRVESALREIGQGFEELAELVESMEL